MELSRTSSDAHGFPVAALLVRGGVEIAFRLSSEFEDEVLSLIREYERRQPETPGQDIRVVGPVLLTPERASRSPS